jgi:hypothetical protein
VKLNGGIGEEILFQKEGQENVYRYSEDPHQRGVLIDRAHSIQLECTTNKFYLVMSLREIHLSRVS